LNEIAKKHGVKVIAISEDSKKTQPKAIEYIKNNGFEFINFFDNGKAFQNAMKVNGIPATFFVNQKGEILYRHIGYKAGDEIELEKHLVETLQSIK